MDTGFTGFLSIPMLQAFPIGLILTGTIPVTLADGSTHHKLTCLGMVQLGEERQVGLEVIEPNSNLPLLGMDFLRKFKKKLLINPQEGTFELL